MKLHRFLLPALMLLAGTTGSYAQARLGFSGIWSIPQTDFKTNKYSQGAGFGFSLLSGNLLNTDKGFNLHIGGEINYQFNGSNKYTVELDSPFNGKGDVKVSNSSIAFNALGRLVYTGYRFEPYAEAFGGLRGFSTTEKISPQAKITNNDYQKETNKNVQDAGTIAGGIGLGVQYMVNDWMHIDLGADYSWGSYARYQVLSKIQQNGNLLNFNTNRTSTDLLLIHLGVVFTLNHIEKTDHRDVTTHDRNPVYKTTPVQKEIPIKPNPKPAKKIDF